MPKIAPSWVLACILLIPLAGVGQSDGRDEAKHHFEAGKVLFFNEDFDAAAVEFAASTELYPTQSGYYNLANCYLALHQYGVALDTLAILKDRFSDIMPGTMRRKVRKTETTIRKITGELSIESLPAGSNVKVNGREISQIGPNNPVVLAPGNYTIEVEHSGYSSKRLTVTVLSQKRRQIAVTLAPLPPPPVQTLQVPSVPDVVAEPKDLAPVSAIDLRPYMWAATVSAAITGVSAVIFYGLAAVQKNEAESLASDWKETYPGTPVEVALESDIEQASENFRTYRNVAYGLTIGSVILAAGAVLLKFGKWDRSSESIDKLDVSFLPGGVEVSF